MNRKTIVTSFVLVLLLSFLAFWWLDLGYGEVSPKAYKIAQALYSASQKKSEQHLSQVEKIYDENREDLSATERQWLADIIEDARTGQWQAASLAARRLLDDQVKR